MQSCLNRHTRKWKTKILSIECELVLLEYADHLTKLIAGKCFANCPFCPRISYCVLYAILCYKNVVCCFMYAKLSFVFSVKSQCTIGATILWALCSHFCLHSQHTHHFLFLFIMYFILNILWKIRSSWYSSLWVNPFQFKWALHTSHTKYNGKATQWTKYGAKNLPYVGQTVRRV